MLSVDQAVCGSLYFSSCKQVHTWKHPLYIGEKEIYSHIHIFSSPGKVRLWYGLGPSSVVHTFKQEYVWSLSANLDHISWRSGVDYKRFWDRLEQNCGFHSNGKLPKTYKGENVVWVITCLFFYPNFIKLANNQHKNKISDEFEFGTDRIFHFRITHPSTSKPMLFDQ